MENAETVDLSATVIIYDMKMQSLKAKGQGHLMTLVKGHLS